MDDGSALAIVKADIEEAHSLQVRSTPTFVINGYIFRGAMVPIALETVVDELLHPSAGGTGHEGHNH